MIRVMLVEDQELIRAGLAAIIRATPGLTVVAEAASGEQAVRQAVASRPDVVLMDIRMPGMDGITATRQIVAGGPDAPRVIVLTTFDLSEYVYAALRAGAAGFLLKDTQPEQLISAITTVSGGSMLFAPTVMRRLIEAYLEKHDEIPRPALRELTERETEVLYLVAKGLSNTNIAARLQLSEATVKTHVNRIMAKLRLSSRAQAVVVAYEAGLVAPRQSGRQAD